MPPLWCSCGNPRPGTAPERGQCPKCSRPVPWAAPPCSRGTPISNEEAVPTSAARGFLLCARMSTKEQGWMEALCPWQASLSPQRGDTHTAPGRYTRYGLVPWMCKEEAAQG